MFLLSKWLEKKGISKIDDLSPEEKVVYDSYRNILSGRNLTVETIKEFCQSQVTVIQSKCDGVIPLTNIQQACLHVYLNIIKAIEAPEAEREALERHLTQLISSE